MNPIIGRWLRTILGLNSFFWVIKIGLYIMYPSKTTLQGVLYWFVSVEYLYLGLLSAHLICCSANLITKDRRAWVVEFEMLLAVILSASAVAAAYFTMYCTPEQLSCLLLSLFVYFKHR